MRWRFVRSAIFACDRRRFWFVGGMDWTLEDWFAFILLAAMSVGVALNVENRVASTLRSPIKNHGLSSLEIDSIDPSELSEDAWPWGAEVPVLDLDR